MKLRDILVKGKPVETIMERCNDPWDKEPDGMLCGYCQWDGENLLPLDGDYYSLDAEIERFEWENDNFLVYWVRAEWSSRGGKETVE